jgi:hypothetical protein
MDQMKGRRENKFCCFVYVSFENRRMLCALVLAWFPPPITDGHYSKKKNIYCAG